MLKLAELTPQCTLPPSEASADMTDRGTLSMAHTSAAKNEPQKEFNWQQDSQHTDYPSSDSLNAHAVMAEPIFIQMAREIRDALDSSISIDESNAIKSVESIDRKLHDSSVHGNLKNIGDPIRVSFIIPENHPDSVSLLQKAIVYIKNHPHCTSWKDEYAFPDKDSHYSSFKAHMKVQTPDGRWITGEVQIHHESMLLANNITKRLSNSIRCIEEKIRDTAEIFRIDDSTLRRQIVNLSNTKYYFDQVKQLIHDSFRSSASLDALLASEMRAQCAVSNRTLPQPTKGARSILSYLLPEDFQKLIFRQRPVNHEQVSALLLK